MIIQKDWPQTFSVENKTWLTRCSLTWNGKEKDQRDAADYVKEILH